MQMSVSRDRRKRQNHEDKEQRALFQWRALQLGVYPGIHLMHSNLNGAYLQGGKEQRSRQWKKLEAMGALVGVFDVFLPVARGGYHGLYIEMKPTKEHKSAVRDSQKAFSKGVAEQCYLPKVAYGWLEAVEIIKSYYGEK